MPSRRIEALNAQFREEISQIMQRELRDPALTGLVSITTVEVSPDLSFAKVYVSALGTEVDRQRAVEVLRHASRFIRHQLAQRLTLRHTPQLDFRADESLERGERILDLLRQAKQQSVGATPPVLAELPADDDDDSTAESGPQAKP